MTAVGGASITLEPLRSLGPDSLRTINFPELTRITLIEIHVTHVTTTHQVVITCAANIFDCPDAISATGVITAVVFDLEFADNRHATLQLRLPDIITLIPDNNFALVERWLTQSGFLILKPVDFPLMYSI